MKIVMIVRLFAPHLGGVEKHVEAVASEAVDDGHDVVVITSQHTPSLAYRSRVLHGATSTVSEGIRTFRIPKISEVSPPDFSSKLLERARVWWWMLRNINIFLTADIIHIHDIFWWYWPIRILLPSKKVFMTFHGFEAGSLPTPNAIRARKIAEKMTRANICVGQWIEKWYGTKATRVTYGAAHCSLPTKKKSVTPKNRAIFVGRLEKDTGILTYIKAMKKKNMYFDVFGDGPLLAAATEAAKGSRIHIMGKTNDTCMLYPQYSVACVSSYLSMIEALQCGLPVIAYCTDPLKEDYIRSFPVSGQITIARSQKELLDGLASYSAPDMQSKTAIATRWAKQQTWKSVYREYEALWNT